MRLQANPSVHPRALATGNLVLTLGLSVVGAIVGIQMLVTLGITPNTSLLGALAAMALARIPLRSFAGYRSIHSQNLAQTSISAATFGAANCLFLPIGIPYLFGLPEMVWPMLAGVSLAMLLDAFLLYRLFGSAAFPATNAWPMGVASAEAIKAGDRGGRQAWLLVAGVVTGATGTIAGIPMSAFGVALIGGAAAMTAFSIGLLARGYSTSLFGLDIGALYVPHGMMIGAGLVALVQVVQAVVGRRQSGKHGDPTRAPEGTGAARVLRFGGLGYLAIMVFLTTGTGVYAGMSPLMLVGFVVFGTFSAFMHELIVGIAAMHSGWFPAFAVALISLLIGIMIGFPPEALVVLAGFSAATGPAFADMGYDLKAGYLLRGERMLDAFELEGRRQQWIASLIGFLTAIVVVAAVHRLLLSNGLNAPINATYVAAIEAGISSDVARQLALCALPGAALQVLGGPRRQVGVLLATGLLITNPAAGWMVLVGLALRLLLRRRYGDGLKKQLEVLAGGVIAGDALCGFAMGAGRSFQK
jgi:uncharacterized oligopeptide transporter (OPT) family protein